MGTGKAVRRVQVAVRRVPPETPQPPAGKILQVHGRGAAHACSPVPAPERIAVCAG